MTASIRLALRAATDEDHVMLENTRLMQALSHGEPSRDDYLEYLWRQWDLHCALESALAPWVPTAWVSERLGKRHWLERDMRALLPAGQVAPTPQAIPLHPITSLAEALGTLYVLEGSTLGLRMMEKRFTPGHPGLSVAGRFIQGYGAEHGLRWKTFLDRLEALPAEDWPSAIVAARATFRTFLDHFAAPAQSHSTVLE